MCHGCECAGVRVACVGHRVCSGSCLSVSVGAAKWVVYLSFGSLVGVASDTVLHLLLFCIPQEGVLVFSRTRVFVLCVCREGSVDLSRVWA